MPDAPQNPSAPSPQGGQPITLRVDESHTSTVYANGFRTSGTAEEVMVDFGVNSPSPATSNEVTMVVSTRVVMNYYSAKRLALALGQAVQQYESQFGVLELDPARRQKS